MMLNKTSLFHMRTKLIQFTGMLLFNAPNLNMSDIIGNWLAKSRKSYSYKYV